MKVIFLDIDGCLNRQHFGKGDQSRFGFDDGCVNSLRYVLTAVPDAKIVVTSAWKKTDVEPRVSATKPWREVLEAKLGMPGVIAADAPGLDGYYKDGKPLTRADDVRGYLSFFPAEDGTDVDGYVIIDDECSCYRGTELEPHVVDCEIGTGRGLDAVNACRAVRILRGESAFASDDAVPDIIYQSVLEDARCMAETLRRIDAALADAARSGGSDRLLPDLCEIMYSCSGNYNSERYG